MIGISEKRFKEEVNIYFSNISEGFSKFKSKMLEEDYNLRGDFIGFILECFKLNGKENSYVDFYYYNLSMDDRKNLRNLLGEDEKEFLDHHIENLDKNTVYFKLTEEFAQFLINLSLKEILFSTFYFTKIPCTIWGNYNKKLPMFFEGGDDIKIYSNICEKYGLKII